MYDVGDLVRMKSGSEESQNGLNSVLSEGRRVLEEYLDVSGGDTS